MDVPSRIGRFTTREPIGQSPTSVVSRAFDEGLNSEAIVKVIQLADERFTLRCMRELERWQGLGIGGIQKVQEFGKVHGMAWYGADPVPGHSLQQEIDERVQSGERWNDKQVFQIGRKIASTLDILHGLQILHGNLKPTNVLGRTDADLVLTDLGLVRATEVSEIPTWVGGLSAYRHMSPDQLLGLKPLDPRSDIYQLGLILYEVATLTHPFAKVESPEGLRDRSLTPFEPPAKLVPGFDSKMSRAIMLCLSRERDRRHPTIKDFLRTWSSVTAKYQSLSDVPVADMNPDGEGAQRRTQKFSGPSPRASGRARVSQQLDASIREIKPTPRWVQFAVVLVLALAVGAAGFWVYTRETVGRVDGGVDQQVGFGGTRISYRTNLACETSVRVSGEGTQARSFKNPKDGVSQKHTVMVSDLTPGRKYLACVEFEAGPPSETWALAAPVGRPITHVRFEPRGDADLALAFRTPVKAKSSARARVDGKEVDLRISTDPDTAHEGVFKAAVPARLKELSIEVTDLEGDKRSLSADELAAQVAAPLGKAVALPALAPSPIPDPVAALDKAQIGPMIADLSSLGAWPFESADLSDERRREVYRAVNGLERVLARGNTGLPPELGMLKPLQASPYLRGQVVTTGELARSCEGAGKGPVATPVALLVQLGVFSRLKPGLFTSPAAKTRVAYDPKPLAADVSATARAVVRLPAPPAGDYRSAQLAVAVSALPRDAILVATARGEPGEVVLYNPAASAAPPPGEQWIARFMPPRALASGPVEIVLSLEPVGTAKPAPLKVLGALLVYR